MKKLICIIVLSVSLFCARAQPADFRADNVWPLAADAGWVDSPYVKLNFKEDSYSLSSNLLGIPLMGTSAAFSDSLGNLQLYTNGVRIVNRVGEIVLNGDSICYFNNSNTVSWTVGLNALLLTQGAIFLPINDKVFLIHTKHNLNQNIYPYYYANHLYMSTCEFDNDLSEWVVTEKAEVILNDSLDWGKITACKHANGSDWWVVIPGIETDKYYVILLKENGETVVNTLVLEYLELGAGQAFFSPDGTKYIRTNSGNETPSGFIAMTHVYNFNRENGELSLIEKIELENNVAWGMSISPNSRFFYLSCGDKIFQYDLNAEILAQSGTLVAEYDGFISPWLETYFNKMQIGPDGRIYLDTGNGTDRLHVIDKPDKAGLDCNVLQHSIVLPNYSRSLPNFPNYRLGPLDGSTADTLGINNIPVAGWRHDTLPELVVEFTDNSYYDVQHWAWTFGDGGIDSIEHPVHTYAAPGYYYVCQTVSNSNAADTLCKWVQVGMGSDTIVYSTVGEYGVQIGLCIYPNPTSDFIFIQGEQAIPSGHSLVLIEALGREAIRTSLSAMLTSIDVRGLASGLYFYNIIAPDGRITQAGKVMKL